MTGITESGKTMMMDGKRLTIMYSSHDREHHDLDARQRSCVRVMIRYIDRRGRRSPSEVLYRSVNCN